MSVSTEVNVVENDLKPLLTKVKAAAARYFTHASGQVIAWYTIATHDLSKWESGAAAAGALTLTAAIRRVNAWLSK